MWTSVQWAVTPVTSTPSATTPSAASSVSVLRVSPALDTAVSVGLYRLYSQFDCRRRVLHRSLACINAPLHLDCDLRTVKIRTFLVKYSAARCLYLARFLRHFSADARHDTIRYARDTMIFTCAQKLTYSQLNLPHGTKQKRIMKKRKIKTEMLRRNGPVIKPWSQSRGREGVYGGKDL